MRSASGNVSTAFSPRLRAGNPLPQQIWPPSTLFASQHKVVQYLSVAQQLDRDGIARTNGFRLEWRDKPVRLEAPLWRVARSATDLLTSPDLQLVRECEDNACRWLFVDRSRNHSRRWCDMKVCGNRIKARTFYRQHKKTASEASR